MLSLEICVEIAALFAKAQTPDDFMSYLRGEYRQHLLDEKKVVTSVLGGNAIAGGFFVAVPATAFGVATGTATSLATARWGMAALNRS